jgi:CheY-like chemotaxis protein
MNSPPLDVAQSRKALNDGIERSFLDTAGYAASIRTHYQTGSGTIRDLYEMFYFNVAVLFDLTSDLQEMNSATDATMALQVWLEQPPVRSVNKDMQDRCMDGLKIFREYKIALSRNGVLSLPS